MQGWKELTQLAMMGTASGRPFPNSVAQELADYRYQTSADMEQSVLQAAALYAILQKAAAQSPIASHDAAQLVADTSEELPLCNKELITLSQYILKNNHEEIVTEFLTHFPADRYRLPSHLLVDLLNYGIRHTEIQADLVRLVGKRGQWLAQFHATWQYARAAMFDFSKDDVFQIGTSDERFMWIQNLRQTDPNRAFELIAQTWKTEDAAFKVRLLGVLRQYRQPSEAEFIKECTQDKRKEVRYAAFQTLLLYDDRDFMARCQALAMSVLQFDSVKNQLVVNLPDTLTPEMEQCGIVPKSNAVQLEGGEKANWLMQIVQLVSPDVWKSSPNGHAMKIINAARVSEWQIAILYGLIEAAKRMQNQEWLMAFNRLYLHSHDAKIWNQLPTNFIGAGLTKDNFKIIANEYLEDTQKHLSDSHPLITLLNSVEAWYDELSLEIINLILIHSQQDSYSFYYGLRALLQRASYAISPALYDTIKATWEREEAGRAYNWQKDFRSFLDTLALRKNFYDNIAKLA